MTIANQLGAFSRVLEDPDEERYTAELFYEGYNSACDYLTLHAPYELLDELSKFDESVSTDGNASEFAYPTISDSETVRLYRLTLEGASKDCIKTPIGQSGVVANSYYASTDINPRYTVTNNKIKFLHTPVTGKKIGFYLIKKQPDVASGTEPIISLVLQRVALRMSVDYGKYADEVISRDTMMSRWDAEIKRLQTVQPQGDM